MLQPILSLLPYSLQNIVRNLSYAVQAKLEEIRIKDSRPLSISYQSEYAFVTKDAQLVQDPQLAYRPTREECITLLELLTNHSVYSFEEELKRGYITIDGGHRVGLAGRTVLEQGQVKQIRDVSSFNIRVARELLDVGRPVLPYLLDTKGRGIHHTLIISPPLQGKTTLVRDIARLISYGEGLGSASGRGGFKVGIVDERSELAACNKGVPRFDLGPCTDVMDSCPKAEGMMMMIRSLSPEVLIVDEIGRPEDATAIREALHAGIRVIATAHGAHVEDVRRRPVLKDLIAEEIFSRFVVLGYRQGQKSPFEVFDSQGKRIEAMAYRIGSG